VAQWSVSDSENITRINTRFNQKTIGLQLNLPLYAGGALVAQTRQATAEHQRLIEQLESARRELHLRVHKEHRAITEGAAKVRALQQAVQSATQLVHSTLLSQQAGVRTFVDVLNAEQQQYQAQKELTSARHQYVLSYLRLTALAGKVDQDHIQLLNSWLQPPNAS
jgi:outer membrane protein, protease secretion system